MPLPDWTETLEAIVVQKTPGNGARLRSFGVVVGLAIAATAVFVLTHVLKNVDYNEVFAVVRRTNAGFIALALALVAISYGSLTLYDLLALRTIGRKDVLYKIAALASFTSYPIAHGAGAAALVSPIIRYRIYAYHGLGAFEVANICFLTGLTFWLGNLTALGLSLFCEPGAISLVDQLPPWLNRLLALALLLGVVAFLVWTWLPPDCRLHRRDIAGFCEPCAGGIGVFDAVILIGLGGEEREPVIAALLMFRFLYHLLPFVMALGLFAGVEGWRSLRATGELSLSPTIPATISVRQRIRTGSADSL